MLQLVYVLLIYMIQLDLVYLVTNLSELIFYNFSHIFSLNIYLSYYLPHWFGSGTQLTLNLKLREAFSTF
jgi:hypothetical protein